MRKLTFLLFTVLSPLLANAQDQDLVQYVNTLQGSHNIPEFSHGRCSPLVGYPHAASLWNPRGNGISGGGIALTPKLGSPVGKSAESTPSAVIGQPHYYKASFDDGVTLELTSSERCGDFQVTYPDSQKAYLTITGNADEIKIDYDQRRITGHGSSFFVIQFDQPFVSHGRLEGDKPGGVYVEFAPKSKVGIKVAPSQISQEQAETTFDRELGSSSFDEVKAANEKVWNHLLNKIVVEGGTPEQRKTFYSCLFRANLRPGKIYEVDKDGQSHF